MRIAELLLMFGCLVVTACAPKIPKNAATSEEKNQIAGVVSEIEDIAAEEGIHLRLNKMPIIVVNDRLHPRRWAYCSKNPDYIAINKTIFAEPDIQSFLFEALLHEVGHCYFHREHDDRLMAFEPLCQSIMCQGRMHLTPELKKYYVRELAGGNLTQRLFTRE